MEQMLRWRRGCATNGHELTDNSEANPGDGELTGELGTCDDLELWNEK